MGTSWKYYAAFFAGMTLLICTAGASAAELQDVSVDVEDGRYTLRSETHFNVEQAALFEVLTNFDLFEQFTSAIVESYNQEPDDEGRAQFYARMEGCVLFWCKSMIRDGYVIAKALDEIVAVSDPEKSDFEYSHERWELSTVDDQTVMIYKFEMEPKFWVPPIVGPYYIKRALRSGGGDAINRIEALALRVQNGLEASPQKIVQSESDLDTKPQ